MGIDIKELMKKIVNNNYDPIPPEFSNDLRDLLAEILVKDPNKRPTMKDILQKKFLAVNDCSD
jgi:NIMA (never in mitosis gene a)-related kinase